MLKSDEGSLSTLSRKSVLDSYGDEIRQYDKFYVAGHLILSEDSLEKRRHEICEGEEFQCCCCGKDQDDITDSDYYMIVGSKYCKACIKEMEEEL